MTPWVGQFSTQYKAEATYSNNRYEGSGETKYAAIRRLCSNISRAHHLGDVKSVFTSNNDQQASFTTTKTFGFTHIDCSLTQTRGEPPAPYRFGQQMG